ncbi:large ribosomal subunit protein bL21m [Ochlerotatus camptorhynchus]|uniref:large ribosomal subunit protein bL21m n=1 Tax=Ochlerotatus camptorhynchus TaxID=644619 RepID=UPI0031CDB9EC
MMLNRLTSFFKVPCRKLLTTSLKTLSVTPTTFPTAPTALPVNSILSRYNSSLVSPQPSASIVQDVKNQIESGTEGRLFAVVQLCGKQFKITTGDIIIVEGYWPPTNGDKIRLDKVLLAGGKDFSLIGKPLVSLGLVDIQATIIEKSLSHTKTHFRKKRRKQYERINFYRTQQTMIRINSIKVKSGGFNEQSKAGQQEVERFC